MQVIQNKLEKFLMPVSDKLGNSKIVQSISAGMSMTVPITLGASIFLILADFPIPAVRSWLIQVGWMSHLLAIVAGSLSILALIVSFTVAYQYGKKLAVEPIQAGLFSVSSFLILTFPDKYEGSTGFFLALIVAISMTKLYAFLTKKLARPLPLPKSIPPMVGRSIEPMRVGALLYCLLFLLRLFFAATPFQTVTTFMDQMVTQPLLTIGGSVPILLVVYIFGNLLFFCGLHPTTIYALLQPIMTTMMLTALEDSLASRPVFYLTNLVTYDFINNDATGSTLSLLVCFLLTGRSKQSREFAKSSLKPNFFNINETVIFGLPIQMNQILAIPFIFSSLITGLIGWTAVKIGFLTTYHAGAAMTLPWTMPKIVTSFFVYGWRGVLVRIICFLMMVCVYYPFVQRMDKQALMKEKENF